MKKFKTLPLKMTFLMIVSSFLFVEDMTAQVQESVTAEVIPFNVDSLYEFLGFILIIGILIGVNELLRNERQHH